MDDYKELDNLLGYSPENEYAGVDDATSNTELHLDPAAGTPADNTDNTAEPDEDAIPFYTPAQFEPTPVEEQLPQQAKEQSAPEIPSEAPRPADVFVQPQAPYAQPVQPYHKPAQPQAPYAQPVQPYRQPAQPQTPYAQPVQPYRQPAQPQTPYAQPVQQYRQPAQPQQVNVNYNPYTQPQPQNIPGAPYEQPQKPKTSSGTKAFIAILAGLLFVMLVAFGVFAAMNAQSKQKDKTPDSIFSTEFPQIDDGDDEFDGFGYDAVEATEFEAEIELIADNGETQQRDSDNKDSVGAPDENAKQIELKPLPSDKGDAKYTTQYAFDTVSPGVVYVGIYEDEITEDESNLISQGTGTVISSDGYIITNAHVIGNSKQYLVQVSLGSGKDYQAKIVGFDNWTDIAVLKIDAKDLTPVVFGDSELIEIGQDVIAIGNAGGTFKNSLTKGVVSAVNRELQINKNVKYIQSDAAINPGNSGGPLCNLYGQVIGITSAKISSNVYESMSFSIPSKTVQEIASDLMRYGYVKGRVRLGISGTEITEEDRYYYDVPSGIIVAQIADDSPLKGVAQENDIITAVDGIEITSFQDIYDILSDHKPGDKVKVKIYREE